MSELVIQTHDFEMAKKGLKKFSQKRADDLKINTVETTDKFLVFSSDHLVTGYELNNRLMAIQNHLVDLNTINNKTIKEFGQVYSALEALDKDYIQAILISIEGTRLTSEAVKDHQVEIDRLINDQIKTLEILKKFKQKLDVFSHLEDIDKTWDDCQKLSNEIVVLSNTFNNTFELSKENEQKVEDLNTLLNEADKNLNALSMKLNQQRVTIETIMTFISELEKNVHLQDIDEMWDFLSNAQVSVANIFEKLESFKDITVKQQSDIEKLQFFKNNISKYDHLNDIDNIWQMAEAHSIKLEELEKQDEKTMEFVQANQISIAELTKQSDETQNIIKKNKENIDVVIESVAEKNDVTVEELTKKIKNVYLLAGGTFGLVIIELLVILGMVI